MKEGSTAAGEMAAVCACDPLDADALLASALAGDVDRAFEHLVIAYRERIVSFVARMLHDDARAEDVAQDVFVRAYRALREYSPERRAALRLRPWLFAIAHNLTRNSVRDAGRPVEPLEYEDGVPRVELTDRGAGPDAVVLHNEAWSSVHAAIARLSPALRAAFVMRYVEDLRYEEIAQSLDQPLGTVKASAHRGLLAVRAHLENENG